MGARRRHLGNTPPRWAGYAQKTKDGSDWAILNDWIDNTFVETVPKALEVLKGAVASGRASSGDATVVLDFLEEALNAKAGLPVTLSYDKKPYTLSPEQAAAARNVALGMVDRLVTARFRQTRALYTCLKNYEEAYQKINREGGRLGFSDYVTLLLSTPNSTSSTSSIASIAPSSTGCSTSSRTPARNSSTS